MSIWDFTELKKNIDQNDSLVTLQEGKTPIQTIRMDGIELVLKREDKNPTGSWKDRATAYKLTKFLQKNIHEGVIFTSGNTAISYLTYIKNLNLPFKLNVVVGNNVKKEKLEIIQNLINGTENKIFVEDNPKLKSVRLSAELKVPNLKASIDDEALESYWSLGFELYNLINPQESNKNVGVFVPASSGNGFVGLSQGLFIKTANEYLMPRMYACQTVKVHPFYNHLNSVEEPQSDSLADAIIDVSGLRAPQVLKVVKETSGDVINVDNEPLKEAEALMIKHNITDLSYNSLLSVAGFLKVKDKVEFKKVICIASGR